MSATPKTLESINRLDSLEKMLKTLEHYTKIKLFPVYREGNPPLSLLAAALKLNKTIEELSLDRLRISDAEAIAIGDAFKSNRVLKKITLSRNTISTNGLSAILGGLKENKSIFSLSISQESIDIKVLTETLMHHESISEVEFNSSPKEVAGASELANVLMTNEKIKKFYLTNIIPHKERENTTAAFVNALKMNSCLTELMLDLGIEDKGLAAIFNALKKNNSLESLNVPHSHFGPQAARELADLFKKNNSLRSIHFEQLGLVNSKETLEIVEGIVEGLNLNTRMNRLEFYLDSLKKSEKDIIIQQLTQALELNRGLTEVNIISSRHLDLNRALQPYLAGIRVFNAFSNSADNTKLETEYAATKASAVRSIVVAGATQSVVAATPSTNTTPNATQSINHRSAIARDDKAIKDLKTAQEAEKIDTQDELVRIFKILKDKLDRLDIEYGAFNNVSFNRKIEITRAELIFSFAQSEKLMSRRVAIQPETDTGRITSFLDARILLLEPLLKLEISRDLKQKIAKLLTNAYFAKFKPTDKTTNDYFFKTLVCVSNEKASKDQHEQYIIALAKYLADRIPADINLTNFEHAKKFHDELIKKLPDLEQELELGYHKVGKELFGTTAYAEPLFKQVTDIFTDPDPTLFSGFGMNTGKAANPVVSATASAVAAASAVGLDDTNTAFNKAESDKPNTKP